MIIVGAGGQAKEILGILIDQKPVEEIFFYDNVTKDLPALLYNKFQIVRTEEHAKEILKNDPRFIIGVGNPISRFELTEKFKSYGGKLTSAISLQAKIGRFNVQLGQGLNVMDGAIITEDVTIGMGTLVHMHTSIHHDVKIGRFCELSPGSRILGKAVIGDFTSIGSGAIVLPSIKIGNNAIVGAGAVVTKDVEDGLTMIGVPARVMLKKVKYR